MKLYFSFIFSILFPAIIHAQSTFNSGWQNYQIGNSVKIYNYKFDHISDSFRVSMTDSVLMFASKDSAVTQTASYNVYTKEVVKTTYYMGKNKLPVKSETFKNNTMTERTEWKYDNKNRMTYCSETNLRNDKTSNRSYEYGIDKATGGSIVTEISYLNGRPEFYTMDYYDKKNVHYKQTRLNDNRKDIIHIETYTYDKNGRLKERAVYFPEFKITKKFDDGNEQDFDKCYKRQALGNNHISYNNKDAFVRKLLKQYQNAILDKDCKALEYIFTDRMNAAIITKSALNNTRTVSIRMVSLSQK